MSENKKRKIEETCHYRGQAPDRFHVRILVKPEADLLLAYDDPLGVTAAFNRNVLAVLNRRLGADLDLRRAK